jgi:hypothetical protein
MFPGKQTQAAPMFAISCTFLASGDWLFLAGLGALHADQSLDGMAMPSRRKGFKPKKCLPLPRPDRRETLVPRFGELDCFDNPAERKPDGFLTP